MCNADWLSICRRPTRSGLPKQRSGPVLDHDGDRRFAQGCVQRAPLRARNQAALLQMALVWFRLAQEHVSDTAEKVES
jgi:hypothetical protein